MWKAAGIRWYVVLVRHATCAYLKTPASASETRVPGCSVLYALHFNAHNSKASTAPYSIDRPDQHIAADIASATESLATLLFGSGGRLSVLQVILTISFTAAAAGAYSPLAVLICFVYTLASLFVTRWASQGVPSATAMVAAMEGAFRTVHTGLVRNAVAVGLLRGEPYEHAVADAAFSGLLAARVQAVGVQFAARLWNNICAQCGTALAYALTLAVVWHWGSTTGTPHPRLQFLELAVY